MLSAILHLLPLCLLEHESDEPTQRDGETPQELGMERNTPHTFHVPSIQVPTTAHIPTRDSDSFDFKCRSQTTSPAFRIITHEEAAMATIPSPSPLGKQVFKCAVKLADYKACIKNLGDEVPVVNIQQPETEPTAHLAIGDIVQVVSNRKHRNTFGTQVGVITDEIVRSLDGSAQYIVRSLLPASSTPNHQGILLVAPRSYVGRPNIRDKKSWQLRM
jgi:hypothetical protein